MNIREEVSKIVDNWIDRHGYVPTEGELLMAYTDGKLELTDAQENVMIMLHRSL